jgi:hypothetical protein
MSISPQVRETGRMEDANGARITFGVDHDAVTIDSGGAIVVAAANDLLIRLLFAAIEAAQAQAGTPCTGACYPPDTEEG